MRFYEDFSAIFYSNWLAVKKKSQESTHTAPSSNGDDSGGCPIFYAYSNKHLKEQPKKLSEKQKESSKRKLDDYP